jgi:hypothetical protein
MKTIHYTGHIENRTDRPNKPWLLRVRQYVNGKFTKRLGMSFATRGDAVALGRQYVKGIK